MTITTLSSIFSFTPHHRLRHLHLHKPPTKTRAQVSLTTPPSPTSQTTPNKTGAIIIGAGLAGLAAAVRLHSDNIPFLLVEASDAVGGRVRTDIVDGFILDRGFQIFITGYPEAKNLLDYETLDLQKFYSTTTSQPHPSSPTVTTAAIIPSIPIKPRPEIIPKDETLILVSCTLTD